MKRGDSDGLRLDRLDIKILSALQISGRMTNLELSDKVGLSPTPCLQRVKRLEKTGCIKSYGAKLDIDRLCTNIVVFTEITLRNHTREDFVKFERGIKDFPHILNCFLVTGGYDYLAQFIAKDIAHYQAAVEALLDLNLGVEKYFSYVTIKQVKRSVGYPVELLLSESST